MIDDIVATVEGLTGQAVVARHDPPGSGYTPAIRFVAELDSGDRVFVKAPPDRHIASWIQQEITFYRAAEGPYLPRFVGARDATPTDRPVLVIEDLSAARWPPPWDDDAVGAVIETLGRVHASPSGAVVTALGAVHPTLQRGWHEVALEPTVLTRTGLCSPEWLRDVLPHFQDAVRRAPLAGDSLCHLDVRSDNLCLMADGSVRFVDWNHACRANPDLDLAFWVPSLAHETGVEPEELGLEVDAGLAAVVAGFFAARAGLPVIPKAPRVRGVQRDLLAVALPWAARCCGFVAP